jgi:cell division protein FtsW
MARKLKSDAVLFAATLVLVVTGLTWIYSIMAVTKSDPGYFLIRQGMWVSLGMVGLIAAMRVDYHVYCNRRGLLWAAGVLGIALVAVLFGPAVKGGRRWLHVASLGIQPSEFAKLVTIFFVATVLAERMEDQEPLEPGFVQAGALVTVLTALILAEPDVGTSLVVIATTIVMMFTAGLSYRWLATASAVGLPAFSVIAWNMRHSQQRLITFWDPDRDPQGAGYQIIQSLIAVGSGGWWGRGFGQSTQKLYYLPEPQNDYIFAVIAEEMGLIGACVVVACFALLIWRGLVAARRAPDAAGSLVATGITAMIGIQALVNLGVVTNLLPAKGIPLPFVSAGGSSMIVSLVAMGVLLNISQQASATE